MLITMKKKAPKNINPLRYPGGKRWFAPYLERILEINYRCPSLFVEPFAGGAGVSLHLLLTDRVEAIGLADRDPLLASFWKTVFGRDASWLLDKIEDTPITLDVWHSMKQGKFTSQRERAFQCLFLNRTSFSGILAKETGPIGGKSQSSKYKIDCRFNKQRIMENIRFLNENYSDRVLFVWNKSWRYTINELTRRVERDGLNARKLLLYLDPPFIHKAEDLYRYYFTLVNHLQLRDGLSECDLPWILSYDDCAESRELYRGLPHSTLDVLYCSYNGKRASDARAKSELIVSNLNNTLSEILPIGKNKRRVSANTTYGNTLKMDEREALCLSNTKSSQTGTR